MGYRKVVLQSAYEMHLVLRTIGKPWTYHYLAVLRLGMNIEVDHELFQKIYKVVILKWCPACSYNGFHSLSIVFSECRRLHKRLGSHSFYVAVSKFLILYFLFFFYYIYYLFVFSHNKLIKMNRTDINWKKLDCCYHLLLYTIPTYVATILLNLFQIYTVLSP